MNRANCEGFIGGRPVERKLDLEDLGVRARLHALADGGSRIAHPRPAINEKFGNRTQCIGEGGVWSTRKCEGMVLANDIVPSLLAVSRNVTVGEVIAGQTLVDDDLNTFQNRERQARKPTHVELVGSSLTEALHANST